MRGDDEASDIQEPSYKYKIEKMQKVSDLQKANLGSNFQFQAKRQQSP